MMHLCRSRAVALALATLLGGCGGDGPAGNQETPPSSITVNVGNIFFQSVRNGSIQPAEDTVAAGGTVTWTWIESGTHSVIFEDAGLPEGPPLAESGSVFSAQFPAAGTYRYECGIHGSVMSGILVVQ